MTLRQVLVCVAAVALLLSSSAVEAQSLRGQTGRVTQNDLRGQTGQVAQNDGGNDAAKFHAAMIQRINQERAKNGLGKLCYNSKLKKAAQAHSEDQAANGQMTHTGSDGSDMSQRVTRAGYKWNSYAENVAGGQNDVEAAMDWWMNSPTHKANILGNFKHVGMGYATGSKGMFRTYWTQVFGSGSSESCEGDESTQDSTQEAASSPSQGQQAQNDGRQGQMWGQQTQNDDPQGQTWRRQGSSSPDRGQQMQNDGGQWQTWGQQGPSQNGFGFNPGRVHPAGNWQTQSW